MPKISLTLLILCSVAVTGSCRDDRDGNRRASVKKLVKRDCSPLRAVPRAHGGLDRGDVILADAPPTKSLYRGLHQSLRQDDILPEVIADLNTSFAWPTDVVVEFRDCGEANAFYETDPPRIIMCNDLVDLLVDVFDPIIQDQKVSDDMAIGATAFIMLHELGHALIDAHQIPVTGREEDAVDQLATWLLVTGMKEGEMLALDAASWFALASQSDLGEGMLWDEHSLDVQRFYNIACWVYGANPSRYRYLVERGQLPRERAQTCKSEYEAFASSWERLLAGAMLR